MLTLEHTVHDAKVSNTSCKKLNTREQKNQNVGKLCLTLNIVPKWLWSERIHGFPPKN